MWKFIKLFYDGSCKKKLLGKFSMSHSNNERERAGEKIP
jgi:hypothetical protein